jgi:hypothetical protein
MIQGLWLRKWIISLNLKVFGAKLTASVDYVKKGTFDIRYLPFIIVSALIILWGLEQKRKKEIDKVRNTFRGLYRPGE